MRQYILMNFARILVNSPKLYKKRIFIKKIPTLFLCPAEGKREVKKWKWIISFAFYGSKRKGERRKNFWYHFMFNYVLLSTLINLKFIAIFSEIEVFDFIASKLFHFLFVLMDGLMLRCLNFIVKAFLLMI